MARPNQREELSPNLIALIDEAIALVPATPVEIAVLERYGSTRWLERMAAVREKLGELRQQLVSF